MNNNQRTFAQEYVKNGNNGTRAYMKAYPDCTYETAMANASDLLRNTKVKEYIEKLQAEIEDEAIMSATERMKWLTNVMKDIEREKVLIKLPTGEEQVLVDKNADLNTKIKALDILNKMGGNYVTKLEGNIGITNIEVDIDE